MWTKWELNEISRHEILGDQQICNLATAAIAMREIERESSDQRDNVAPPLRH